MTFHSRLCATVTAPTMAEVRARRDAVQDADLVEVRLDTVGDPDVAGALAGRRRPVLLTCRDAAQGGHFQGSEETRRRILRDAIESDAEYVDLEWTAGLDALIRHRSGRGVVLSHHDFSGVPADLETMAGTMAEAGAEIVKIAVRTSCLADAVRLLAVSRRFDAGRCILIGMGDAGLVTRVAAARFGNAWTYAGDGVAPGQLSVERMCREFGYRRIGPRTRLYGLVGNPIGHSVSPAMHNAGFAELGTDAVYLPLPVDGLSDLRTFAEVFDLGGVSVTIPFKADALAYAASASATARRARAANTLTWTSDGVVADNTDLEGFLAPLDGVALDGRRAAILGHGGAARTAALGLLSRGASVTLYGRDAARAAADAAEVGVPGQGRPVPRGSWDLLVNATPVGTYPAVTAQAFPEGDFDSGTVYDLVYNPPDTALMQAARLAGLATMGGLDMLVQQARLQQERWCGRLPSARALREAALWKLSTFTGGV